MFLRSENQLLTRNLPSVFLGGRLGSSDVVSRVDGPNTTTIGLAGALLLPVFSTGQSLLLSALDTPERPNKVNNQSELVI